VHIINNHSYTFSSTQDEEEIEEYLRNRYADSSTTLKQFGDAGDELSDEIMQQTLLPGVK